VNRRDMGIILSSYGHAIAIRHDLVLRGNSYMREVARHAHRARVQHAVRYRPSVPDLAD